MLNNASGSIVFFSEDCKNVVLCSVVTNKESCEYKTGVRTVVEGAQLF